MRTGANGDTVEFDGVAPHTDADSWLRYLTDALRDPCDPLSDRGQRQL